MTRAVVYTRVSLDRHGDMLAVDRQREDCLEIIRRRGWQLVGEYSDNSVSASKRDVARPEYNRMVADYEAGLFDAVVCFDLDRLTRQPRQLEDWIDRATDRGLKLVTANGEADLSTDAGRLFGRIKAAVSREEIERKGARQRRAARQRVESGRMSSFKPCLGYTSRNEIVEHEAKVVRELFRRATTGESISSLQAWLNAGTVRPKQSDTWSRTSTRQMLTNPRYAARVVYQGETTATPGTWEPIVSAATFDTVQAILADPRRKTNRIGTARRHLMSGLAVCGVCGARVRGQAYAYVCPEMHVTKAREHVDAIVLGVVRGALAKLDSIPVKSNADPTLDARAAELRARLATIEADYDSGLIDGRRFATASEKVQAELADVDRKRRVSLGGASLALVAEAADPVEMFDGQTLAVRRNVISSLVKVTLQKRATHGAGKFDPESVVIEWVSERP